jgi:hypothetical protein
LSLLHKKERMHASKNMQIKILKLIKSKEFIKEFIKELG